MYRRPVPRRNGLSTNRPFKPPLKPRNSNQIDDNDSNSIDNGINDDNDALINDNDDKEKYFNVLWRQKKKKNWKKYKNWDFLNRNLLIFLIGIK